MPVQPQKSQSPYETLKAKADKLLREGDALAKSNPAESRRILRKCLHYRKLAKAAREQGK